MLNPVSYKTRIIDRIYINNTRYMIKDYVDHTDV